MALRGHRFVLTHDSDFGTTAINEGRPFYGSSICGSTT